VLLWSKDKPVGIMGIGSADNREYSSNDENLLVAVGRQLATTIEKVRLYEEETCRAYEICVTRRNNCCKARRCQL
jgi:GAF domain-containing protein